METEASGVGVELGCSFFDDDGCAGVASPPAAAIAFLADTGGTWVELSHTVAVPAGSASARCKAELTDVIGSGFDAQVDQIRLLRDAEIFGDGFESGDTSAWAAQVP